MSKKPTAREVLAAAESLERLFAKDGVWVKGVWAVNAAGQPIENECSPDARCFCLSGGINHITGFVSDKKKTRIWNPLNVALRAICNDVVHKTFKFERLLMEWNDNKATTIDDVRELTRIVVARARAKVRPTRKATR